MPRSLSLAVVGADYPNKDGGNRRSEIAFLSLGDPLELRPEPLNPYDEHAIAVRSASGFQIGYIASQRAVFLKKLLREGAELKAVFQDIAPWGAICRIGVDCAPTLPAAEESVDDDSGDDDYDQTPRWPDD